MSEDSLCPQESNKSLGGKDCRHFLGGQLMGGVGGQEDQIEVENLATGCFLSPGNQSQSSSLERFVKDNC